VQTGRQSLHNSENYCGFWRPANALSVRHDAAEDSGDIAGTLSATTDDGAGRYNFVKEANSINHVASFVRGLSRHLPIHRTRSPLRSWHRPRSAVTHFERVVELNERVHRVGLEVGDEFLRHAARGPKSVREEHHAWSL
jgi:hypothetical protein